MVVVVVEVVVVAVMVAMTVVEGGRGGCGDVDSWRCFIRGVSSLVGTVRRTRR